MGSQKHEMMRAEEQQAAALQIARQVGALQYCARHGNYSRGVGDIESAYSLGNARFTRGELDGLFDDRRQMTDAIQSAVASCQAECYPCLEDDD